MSQSIERISSWERQTARQILNALDRLYEPGPNRSELRGQILDQLAWFRRQVVAWLQDWLLQNSEKNP